MGAPCPSGSNLYSASILSAIVTYRDAYTQQNVTVDLVQYPNATLNVEFDNLSNEESFPILSNNATFRTAAESLSGNTSTGAVYTNGENGNFGYQGCISPVQANTTYTQPITVIHPASPAGYSQIIDNIGGSAIEFWIHWVYPSGSSTSSSSSNTSLTTSQQSSASESIGASSSTNFSSSTEVTAPEFPSAIVPLLLLAAVASAAFTARSLRKL
jgi:hypothetical protein